MRSHSSWFAGFLDSPGGLNNLDKGQGFGNCGRQRGVGIIHQASVSSPAGVATEKSVCVGTSTCHIVLLHAIAALKRPSVSIAHQQGGRAALHRTHRIIVLPGVWYPQSL